MINHRIRFNLNILIINNTLLLTQNSLIFNVLFSAFLLVCLHHQNESFVRINIYNNKKVLK